MKTNLKIAATTAVLLSSFTGAAGADDMSSVKAFYSLLSNPASESHVAAFTDVSSASWESIGNYSGENKSREAFLGQVGGFAKLIPDLKWEIKDIHQSGDTYTVRSRATGTPVAPFFGVDGQGRSFDIMTIDIHTFEDGKVVRTYHVEDWATALQQLSGK